MAKGGSYSIARDEIQLNRAIDEANHFKSGDLVILISHSSIKILLNPELMPQTF